MLPGRVNHRSQEAAITHRLSSPSILKTALVAAALSVGVTAISAQPEAAASQPSAKQLAKLCAECFWVAEVTSYEHKGEGSGLGAVGGAVIGGLLGNQVGGGTGKKLATVGGAVAGGYAGHEVEKRSKSYRVWVVTLIDKQGHSQKHELRSDPQLRSGDIVVQKDGGRLERR